MQLVGMAETLIALLQPVHGTISELEAKVALSAADLIRYSRAEVLDGITLSRDETASADWIGLQRTIARDYDERVTPHVRAGAALAYFGLAPIPVAMQLGYLLEEWPAVDVYQRRHDGTNAWAWADTAQRVRLRVDRSHSVFPVSAEGDVVVRITTWHPIDASATRDVLTSGALLEVDVTVESPGPDALVSAADVRAVREAFRAELDAISDAMPASTIHLFAAVPVGLALELGRAVSPTKHRRVQTYQFNTRETPSYRPALVLQDVRVTAPQPPAPAEIERATESCMVWADELDRLATVAREDEAAVEWMRSLALERPWRELPGLGCIRPVLTRVSIDPQRSEFVFDRERGEWKLSPQLLIAIEDAVPDDVRRRLAIRLFFEHEGLHHEWHGLSAGTSSGVGRLPRVLEELDYQADVWAMLQELARHPQRGDGDAVLRVARDMVETAIDTFWAFDRSDEPLREIQVRRLNRYLIWYWQALHLERAESLADVVGILTSKPTLEIAGLVPHVSGERVVFRLDRGSDNLEVGVFAGNMIERRPDGRAYAVRDIVRAFRDRNGGAIKDALRSVFDNVYARGQRAARQS